MKARSMKIEIFIWYTNSIKSDEELIKTLHEEKVIINAAWHIKGEIENTCI